MTIDRDPDHEAIPDDYDGAVYRDKADIDTDAIDIPSEYIECGWTEATHPVRNVKMLDVDLERRVALVEGEVHVDGEWVTKQEVIQLQIEVEEQDDTKDPEDYKV